MKTGFSLLITFRKISMLLFFFLTVPTLAQKNEYAVYALKFGARNHKISIPEIAVGSKDQDSVNVIFMYWLLLGENGKKVLVDAGFTADAGINPYYIRFTRPDSILRNLKVSPEEITDIVITHPHWDHIGGIDLYPNARVWMQKRDYEYFVGTAWQEKGNNEGFNQKDVVKIVRRNLDNQLTLVEGDDLEILPGIRVYIGSKHTYESQFVLVETGDDKVIIASDNAWYYYNLEKLLPIPITHDAEAYVTNLKRMKSMLSNTDLIIPGHDPLVFSKFPMIGEDIVRIK